MIAVVGGGLTGLALGHELARRGLPHRVLEASDRAGGVIRSGRVEDRLLEWGPQRARLTRDLHALILELDLQDEMIAAPPGLPLYVYARGRLRRVPYSVGDLARTDLLSLTAKLRLLLEPFTRGARASERVGDLFTRKFGREAYERLLGPLYGGLYASDPSEMEVGLSLGPLLRELGLGRSFLLPLVRRRGRIAVPPAVSFRGGLQALTDALHARNRESVTLGARVNRIRRSGTAFLLDLDEGSVPAHRVVVTTPAPATAAMLRELAPEASRRIASLRYNPLAVVHLDAGLDLRALGYQVALGEGLRTRGVTFNESLFGRPRVYTAYLGGAASPEIVDRPDEEIAAAAIREFQLVTGGDARALSVVRQRMPAWDLSWTATRGLALPDGISIAASWESRPGIPGRLAQARRLADRFAAG